MQENDVCDDRPEKNRPDGPYGASGANADLVLITFGRYFLVSAAK